MHLRGTGAECLAVVCDVADENQIHDAFEQIRTDLGPPSALVASAGIDRGGRIHDLDAGTWDEVIAINLRGTFLACREAVRSMLGDGGGAIVCVSSPFALVAAAGVAAYGASKAGICALVRSLAVDYASEGIRVNALLPGPTETELMWANVPMNEVEATRETVCREVPLARLADPEEIARAALWLVSDSASYVTGAQLACDGGLLARAAISV
jgi:NAD(P)-dependent dehydrogenase (short-subunit alcohol dehydrogenase family)